jgi:multiple sugar transport system substrate-binding protein
MTRRRVLAALTAGGAGAALAACGGGAAGGSGAPAKLKAGSTVIFWNDQGGGMPGLMKTWGDRFEQQTGVKVEVSGGMQDYRNKVMAAFTAGSGPDLYRFFQETFSINAAVERNMLYRLDNFIKQDKYDLTDFRKEAVDQYRWKGVLYGLPRAFGLQCVFYNTAVFSQQGVPPIPGDWTDKTWNFQAFVDAAQRVARTGERYALYVPRATRLWASFLYSNGGAIVKKNSDGVATEFAIADPPAVEALQLMQDLIYKYKVSPTPAEEGTLGAANGLLQQGKLGMLMTNPGGNEALRQSGAPYDTGVFPIGKGAKRGVGGGGTGWGVAGTTKLPEEAWKLLAFITSKEAQLEEVKEGSTTPVRISISTSQSYLAPPPAHARVFADGQDYVVRDPVHTRWPELEQELVTKLFNDQLWTGKATAAQITKQIKEQGDAILKS